VALFKYLGPHDEVSVRVAGNDIGTVERDSSIAVPDELADLTEWPDENWERADKPKAKPKASDNK